MIAIISLLAASLFVNKVIKVIMGKNFNIPTLIH